jgi:hypothetical protein
MTQPILIASLLLGIIASLSLTDAATHVAVLEFGNKGSVHASQSPNEVTTVLGVSSFWDALHNKKRNLQHSGLTVVPDLFNRPDDGLVIAFNAEDVTLENMPFVQKVFSGENPSVVGVMKTRSTSLKDVLSGVPNLENVDLNALSAACKNHLDADGFSGFLIESSTDNVDSSLAKALNEIQSFAETEKKTIVVHVVINMAELSSRRRLSRQLEEQNANQENAAAEGDNNKEFSGYYGFGYYNSQGEWVTPYKTMFQIQYFNVVVWTSVGLAIVLFFVIGLMVYMPLEPDTLLFGESAKFVGDE